MRRTVEPPDARCLLLENETCTVARTRLDAANGVIEVVAEASNGLGGVDKAARCHLTVILMDIRMPDLDGLKATRRILAADETAREPAPTKGPRVSSASGCQGAFRSDKCPLRSTAAGCHARR